MRLINYDHYKYIEYSLYNYHALSNNLVTEMLMKQAIDNALTFFKGELHEIMIREFYFKRNESKKRFTNVGHYAHVCRELLGTEEANGYVIRREIVYRIAMECCSLGLIKLWKTC